MVVQVASVSGVDTVVSGLIVDGSMQSDRLVCTGTGASCMIKKVWPMDPQRQLKGIPLAGSITHEQLQKEMSASITRDGPDTQCRASTWVNVILKNTSRNDVVSESIRLQYGIALLSGGQVVA